MLDTNEIIGQSFPGPGKGADRGRGTPHSEQHRKAAGAITRPKGIVWGRLKLGDTDYE